ncbi:MAG: PTS sugar transporter subunit IIA [Anaerolineales bacterium]|jgi:transcriptional antiterminator/mannitol/fructose-specific phosphotransferase system IIA component (Ntr-type)
MITLNTRQRDILLALLETDGPITLSKLAQEVRINTRMVRYNLNTVEVWLHLENVDVIRRPGFGIYVDAPKAQRKQLVSKINKMGDFDLMLTTEQRCRAILLYLLTTQQGVTSTDLGRLLEVSRSTIFRDFQIIEGWLDQFNLILERKPRTGVYIKGQEAFRRFALSQLIRDELGPTNWLKLSRENEVPLQLEGSIMEHFRDFLDTLELVYCRRIVSRIEGGLGYELPPTSRSALLLKSAILIQALNTDRIETEFNAPGIHTSSEFQIAELVALDISHNFGFELPESELHLLTIHIQRARVSPSFEFLANPNTVPVVDSQQYIGLAQAVVSRAATQLHPWLMVDRLLTVNLAQHFSTTIPYLSHGFRIRNTLLPQIKSLYPNIWGVAVYAAQAIAEEIGVSVPDEEIGYLIMYFASALERLRKTEERSYKVVLVCDEEISSLILLHERLTTELPNLRVVDVANSIEPHTHNLDGIDLVISTIPLQPVPQTIIEVSPFLKDRDLENIRKWLSAKEKQERLARHFTGELPSIVDLLKNNSIVCGIKATGWEDAVDKASEPLVTGGQIESRYIDAMKAALKQHGPFAIIAPGVALLHAKPSAGVVSLCLGLALLKKGVEFGHAAYDPVDIIFVLGAIDDRGHILALRQLVTMIRNQKFLQTLRRARSAADALRTVWKHIPQAKLPEYM